MLPEIKPSTNGKYEAPLPEINQGGAFPMPAPRTTFPEDPPLPALPTLLYNLSHYCFGGVQLVKWIYWVLLFGAALWALGLLPGHWWGMGACLLLLLAFMLTLLTLRRRDFVAFYPLPLPERTAQRLTPKQKIPVHTTGLFMVENKYRRYTWLPGFYRTFATRERALLCQVQDRNFWHMSHWPEAEIGLWYVFFMPEAVQQIRWGQLRFGRTIRPAIAITYQISKPRRKGRADANQETVYLTVQNLEEGHMILADLQQDVPAHVWIDATSTGAAQE